MVLGGNNACLEIVTNLMGWMIMPKLMSTIGLGIFQSHCGLKQEMLVKIVIHLPLQ